MFAQKDTPQEGPQNLQMPLAPESGTFPKLKTEQAEASRNRVSDLIAGSLADKPTEAQGVQPLTEKGGRVDDVEPFGFASDYNPDKPNERVSPLIVKGGATSTEPLPTTQSDEALKNTTEEEIDSSIVNVIPEKDSESTSAA